jgi:hypothetical protein
MSLTALTRGSDMQHVDMKLAKFLKASNELEQYLHTDGRLTALQQQTIETTIMGLQTLMQSWARKNRTEEPTILS